MIRDAPRFLPADLFGSRFSCRKEAPKENELSRIGAKKARIGANKLKLGIFWLKKYRKSTKAATKLVSRSAERKRIPSLFRIAAEFEQLAASVANLEQFGKGERREASVKDARFKLLLANERALHICWGAVRSAPMTKIEKLERRTNLALAAQKENELDESGCFGGRFFFCMAERF